MNFLKPKNIHLIDEDGKYCDNLNKSLKSWNVYDKGNSFAFTRSSKPPDTGVYALDRLRLACYISCVEETFGKKVEGGYVEYIAGGIIRYSAPGPKDRRAMIRAIKSAKRIIKGEVPRKPVNAPCESCIYSWQCNSGPKPLSLFLD